MIRIGLVAVALVSAANLAFACGIDRRRVGLKNSTKLAAALALIVALTMVPPARAQNYGPWSAPVNLDQDNLDKCRNPASRPVANTSANDGAPALSWDGLTMIFYSNRPGPPVRNHLYVSTRTKLPDSQ
jgi:hypothetical protein